MSLKENYMLQAVALLNEGKTNPEIAESLGLKLHQVGSLLSYARKDGFKIPPRNYGSRERHAIKRRSLLSSLRVNL